MKPTRHALLASGLVLLFFVSSAAPAAWAMYAPSVTSVHTTAVSVRSGQTVPHDLARTLSLPPSMSGPVPAEPASGPSSVAPASVAPLPVPQASSPLVIAGWDALHYGTNSGISNGWVPPDVQVAAGPDHVVEMVNLLMGVYTKQGAQLNVTALSSLFNSGGDFISDPKVQYDAASGRWFASVTDVTKGQVLLIVSASSDPTGSWRHFAVPAAPTTQCLDQPILGLGTTSIIVSVNVFSSCTSNTYTYVGAQYWVVSKADLLAGAAVPAVYASVPDVNEGSIHPVQIQASSDAHYMVSTYWPGTATTSNTLHLFTVSGTPPGVVTVTVTSLSMRTAALPPAASQKGTTRTLDSGDIRVADATWAAGRLWLGFDEACLADTNRACVRLVEIDTFAKTILQDFDLDVAGKDVYYPAFRLDGQGNLAIVVGYSSSSDYPGIVATGRLVGDAPNTVQTPKVVVAGTGPEKPQSCTSTCRYGDYFGAGLDPSDPTVVWLAGEMGTSSGWGTHIFGVRVKAELTLLYFVQGGGTGYSAPILSYVINGTSATLALSNSLTPILADPLSAWSISPALPGSTAQERWGVNRSAGAPATSGFLNASFNATFVYFHQYVVSLLDAIAGGPVPTVKVTAYGVATSVPAGALYWLDAGSPYLYENPVHGSTTIDRWATNNATSGTVQSAATVSVRYYHQFNVTFDYAVIGGGTGYSAPTVDIVVFGASTPLQVSATAWVDAQTVYTYDSVLPGSDATQRWAPGPNAVGTIVDASRILVTYTVQYRLTIFVNPAGAAPPATTGGWYAAGSTVSLNVAQNASWAFQGWIGSGNGSYTGTNANVTFTMNGPVIETSTYYPGLTIVAGAGGSIQYAYGSTSGAVPAGSSVTIYVAPGTTVTLSAAPSSLADAFSGWAGAAGGMSTTSSVHVNGPATVTANFGTNPVLVGGILAAVLVAIALTVLLFARRRKKQPPV
ncbi:MAG: hypothetical protein WC985_02795 [Thermoplasmata archaeon]